MKEEASALGNGGLDVDVTPPPLIEVARRPDDSDFDTAFNPTVARAKNAMYSMKNYAEGGPLHHLQNALESLREVESLPPELIPPAAREAIAIVKISLIDAEVTGVNISSQELELFRIKWDWTE